MLSGYLRYVSVLVFDKRRLLTTAKETRWHSPQDYDKVLKLNHICEKTKCEKVRDVCKLLVVGDVDYEFVRLAVGKLELIFKRKD